jgi:hypothetical protein
MTKNMKISFAQVSRNWQCPKIVTETDQYEITTVR